MSNIWDEGDIAQAVTKAKTLGAIFVVFVEGENELSTQYKQFFEDEHIAHKLKSNQFVSIKVQENSIPHQQFKAIYPHTSSPAVFFIGKNGKLLKLVSENIQLDEFKATIESTLEQFLNGEDKVVPSTSLNSQTPQAVSEDKVQHAKELIEKKREDKKKQEQEAERLKEIERRKTGQNVQQLKKWQQDEEIKQLKEERDREKRENQAARERILAQIAQDKAERAAKFSQQSPSSASQVPQSSAQNAPRILPKSDVTRLQFRLPDGSSQTHDFKINDSLDTVHQYIRNEMNLPFVNYALSTTFPRREFTESDNSQSLLDLQLVPNAVILIIPQNQSSSAPLSSTGSIGSIFWWILTPIFSMYDYLVGMIFGTQRRSVEPTTAKRPATEMSDSTRSVPKKQANDSTTIKRQGNIHRLNDRKDTDDDNNTWNGNSTQQM